MKLSKENHIRSAVVISGKEGNIAGTLYKIPGEGTVDLKKRMLERDKAVKSLYNIFNQIQLGNEPKEWKENRNLSTEENTRRMHQKKVKIQNYKMKKACSRYVNTISRTINELLFFYKTTKTTQNNKVKYDKLKMMHKNEDIISKMKNENILQQFKVEGKNGKLEKGKLEDFVTLALRSSLVVSRYKGKDFDSVAAVAVFLENIGNNNISHEDERTINILLDLIREDFTKLNPNIDNTMGARLIRSVTNQNMLVQPQNDRFSFPCVHDSGKSKVSNKNVEKSGLDNFLLDYANLDKDIRENYLRKLRRIIDIYFSAPITYQKDMDVALSEVVVKDKFDVWKKHNEGKKDSNTFVKVPEVLIKAERDHEKLDTVIEKQARKELADRVRKQNMTCYRYTQAVVKKYNAKEALFFENDDINQYWIHHIENAVERILKSCKIGTLFKLHNGYLIEKVWKDVINLISIKYIALGKVVYNFALDDIWNDNKVKRLGDISEKIRSGITSFDYEMLKAQETLQRELAVNVAFSANNLARAVCNMSDLSDKTSDFLLWQPDDINNKMKKSTGNDENNEKNKRAVCAVLQFFGGKSLWNVVDFEKAYKNAGKHGYGVYFINDLRKAIFAARNESFHFKTASVNNEKWDVEFLGRMFEKETEFCLDIEKERFYSNNLPMFYKSSNLEKMLNHFYSKNISRTAQVLSYNTVFVRKTFPEYLNNVLKYKKPGTDAEILDKWYSACYYLLKEIYYNSFLQSKDAFKYFENAVYNLNSKNINHDSLGKKLNRDEMKRKKAAESFQRRFVEIKRVSDSSISYVCQVFMTDYNQQNNQNKKVRSSNDSLLDKPIYQHFKMLLKETIKSAFAAYLKDNNNKDLFGFIGEPLKINKNDDVKVIKKEEFLPDWKSEKYSLLIEKVKKSPKLQMWYIVGKFLNARSLNLMAGSMRSYLQYVSDINKRANVMGSKLHVEVLDKDTVKDWIQVIEVCLLLASRTSNQFDDYFNDGDDYAGYLKSYVDFSDENMPSAYSALVYFSDQGKIDLYVDPKNPKINRNIVQSKLFAADHILGNGRIVQPVSKDDIVEFYNLKAKIADSKIKGENISEKEQRNIIRYQRLKNKVELRDIVEYGEIINELLGQLINWSFMRERDLLYFQLGFHYNCLRNNSEKPEEYKRIEADDISINDAVLYQIIGMYVNGIPVYTSDNNKLKGKCVNGGAGGKIAAVCEYSEYLGFKKATLYESGLEVFEVLAEHDDIIKLRNGIEHFKYYLGNYRSIMSLYSEVFDRFFTYDLKYQKNVLNLLQNILLRHNIVIVPEFESGTKKVGKNIKQAAKISIKNIQSDKFTYKIKGGTASIDAKDDRYLETIKKILYYPEYDKDSGGVC